MFTACIALLATASALHLPTRANTRLSMTATSTPLVVEAAEQYSLSLANGASAIVRTYGGNSFSYITKDGIQVMGTRKDAPNPIAGKKAFLKIFNITYILRICEYFFFSNIQTIISYSIIAFYSSNVFIIE